MGYNKAREEQKWKKWKEHEEEQMRMLGMSEDSIQKLRDSDWADFKAERCYREHWAAFPEYPDWENAETDEPGIYRITGLLDSIGDKRLFCILSEADRKTLQILLLKMMGFSVSEIADKLEVTEYAIYNRIKRLKKKLNNFS